MESSALSESVINNQRIIQRKCNIIETIDYQVKMINYNRELPLLMIDVLTMNDTNILNYDITGYKRLFHAIKEESINSQVILNSVVTLVSTLLNLSNYFLKRENLCLDSNYIFFDSVNKEIRLLYFPIRDGISSQVDIKIIILNFLSIIKRDCSTEEIIDECITRVRDDSITLEELKELIEKLEVNKKNEAEINSINKEKKGFFEKLLNKTKEKEIKIEAVEQKLQRDNKFNEPKVYYLVIMEESNKRTIPLEKDIYLLGRLEGAVDICIKNSSIGRIHGRIEKEESEYYYIDLDSKNGSYINGERIMANRRYPLICGSDLKLANVSMYIQDDRGK